MSSLDSDRRIDPEAPLLRLENAEIWRGTTRVFEHLDLELPRDRSSVVLGPNGSGKTTLLRLLACELYPVYKPSLRFEVLGHEGWDVLALRRHLGLVSTDLQLRFKRPIHGIEVVHSGFTAGIGLFRSDDLTVAQHDSSLDWMARLGIAHLERKNFREMSQGEQRRCLLARALVHDPDYLILDEPTNSLDLKARFELIDLLSQLVAEGRTLVLVTHAPSEIIPEIEWALLLGPQGVVEAGPRSSILSSSSLSTLFDTQIELFEHNGFYHAVPAAQSSHRG